MNSMYIRQGLAAAAVLLTTCGAAQAGIVFNQGFEADTTGWSDENSGWAGVVTRTASGTDAITSFAGSFHAVFEQSTTQAAGTTGPFTSFDGYRSVFPAGGYSASIAVYLDVNWAAGEGFDYAVASSGSDGAHQRDFIFHVTKDTSTGDLLVGGSNNTNFDPREDLDTLNHYVVATSGWYILEHVFRDDGGILAVDLNLLDALGNVLFTETRSTAADTIPAEVGGNRYGWFTNIDINGGVAVDASQLRLAAVPEPGTLALFGLGLAGIGLARRRRSV